MPQSLGPMFLLDYMAKRIKVVDEIKVAYHLILRWEDTPRLPRRFNLITQALKAFLIMFRERDVTTVAMSKRCYVTGFEDRGRWSLEAGKSKESGSSLEPPEGRQVC